MLEWIDRPHRSDAGCPGLRLVALRVAGGWAYEIYRADDRRPIHAGAVAGWTRAHAKDAAAGQAALMLGQTAPDGTPATPRPEPRRAPRNSPAPQRLRLRLEADRDG